MRLEELNNAALRYEEDLRYLNQLTELRKGRDIRVLQLRGIRNHDGGTKDLQVNPEFSIPFGPLLGMLLDTEIERVRLNTLNFENTTFPTPERR